MKRYNIILIYNEEGSKILMCKRNKEPYDGKINLIGGKVEDNETAFDSAYRELYEETGIRKEDTILYNLINFRYVMDSIEIILFFGKLNKDKELIEEDNELIWVDENEEFYDLNKFAGEGNIWHIVHYAKDFKDKLL